MPFLYHLILAKLQGKEEFLPEEDDAVEDDPADMLGTNNADLNTWVSSEATEVEPPLQPDGPNPPPKDCPVLLESDINELKGGFLSRSPDPKMAQTICSMVAFGANQRHNSFQLGNSLIFITCGVSERGNAYLNYIGLCSSRKTAHVALSTLGKQAKAQLVSRFVLERAPVIGPNIFYNNLDFQQKIPMKSVAIQMSCFMGLGVTSTPPPLVSVHL
ncbi:hypothetical protein PCANC_22796 [Puccinia coronata f. sp. avenae]|uniref:Uncharacterized protein n=1 Tax=Puccinia coronata f. sp. avenae TaxID=200324 RepID=A0A2N5U2X5_9BASI|nr:hypothetical protein PCANC_22796 [Puccinia coronata f. sp. avenae]